MCLMLLAMVCILQAQTRVAIMGGVHSASIKTDDASYENNSRTGIHAGFLLDVPFSSRFSFQPAAMYSQKGAKFESPTLKTWQYVNYIDIPLNLVFKAPLGGNSKFLLGAGPYVAFLIGGKEKSQSGSITTEVDNLPRGNGAGQYQGFNYGWNALAGVEFGRVFITANYSHGLNEFYQTATHQSPLKLQTIGGTIGIFLNRGVPKVKDRDKDGILDAVDECPDEAGTALTKGCPDRDADGIADKNDQCPDVSGTAKYNGCPIPDTDKDGINDENDKCPTVAGIAKYNGCPIPDTDNDGINDEEDKCPNVPGIARLQGCPIPDSDNDGINDEEDNCPSRPGTRENNGCPEINGKLIDRVNTSARSIQFTSNNSAVLGATAKKVLNDVATIMKEDPDLKLSIEAHTSPGGKEETNMKVSQARAEAVKAYLEQQGVEADRMQVQGFGSTQPINSGTTAADKAKNRRVELKLSNH